MLFGESFMSTTFLMSSFIIISNWCIWWGVWLKSLSKQSLTLVVSNYCTHWVISRAWCSKLTFLLVFWWTDSWPTDSSEVLNFMAISRDICLSYLWMMSIWRRDISTSSFEALFFERSSSYSLSAFFSSCFWTLSAAAYRGDVLAWFDWEMLPVACSSNAEGLKWAVAFLISVVTCDPKFEPM